MHVKCVHDLYFFQGCIDVFPGNRMKRMTKKLENATSFNCTEVEKIITNEKTYPSNMKFERNLSMYFRPDKHNFSYLF